MLSGGGRGARKPGRKGGGRCTGGGRKGEGSRIPKVAGSGRKGEKLRNIALYLAIEKGWGLGLKGTGSGKFKPPCPPPLSTVFVKYSLQYSSVIVGGWRCLV